MKADIPEWNLKLVNMGRLQQRSYEVGVLRLEQLRPIIAICRKGWM